MTRRKGIFLLVTGALVVAAGLYLSGYLTLLLLGLDIPLRWNTYLDYWQVLDQPRVAPHATRIKAGGVLGFGFPVLGYAGLLALALRSAKTSLHGNARFANAGDLARQKLSATPRRNRSQSHGPNGSVSFSESEERRALMLPQELKALGPDKEVFLYEGVPHPVMCEKIKYYQDKRFTSRLLPKIDMKMLDIGQVAGVAEGGDGLG